MHTLQQIDSSTSQFVRIEMNGHLHLVQNIYHDEWIPMIYLYTNKTSYRQGQKKCEVKVTSYYHGVSLYCNQW